MRAKSYYRARILFGWRARLAKLLDGFRLGIDNYADAYFWWRAVMFSEHEPGREWCLEYDKHCFYYCVTSICNEEAK